MIKYISNTVIDTIIVLYLQIERKRLLNTKTQNQKHLKTNVDGAYSELAKSKLNSWFVRKKFSFSWVITCFIK